MGWRAGRGGVCFPSNHQIGRNDITLLVDGDSTTEMDQIQNTKYIKMYGPILSSSKVVLGSLGNTLQACKLTVALFPGTKEPILKSKAVLKSLF